MSYPKQTRDIETRKAEREVVVHDPTHGKVHVLNVTAGRVLALCDGAHSSTEIARSLSDATGADLAAVSQDVEAILRDFTALQLIST